MEGRLKWRFYLGGGVLTVDETSLWAYLYIPSSHDCRDLRSLFMLSRHCGLCAEVGWKCYVRVATTKEVLLVEEGLWY